MQQHFEVFLVAKLFSIGPCFFKTIVVIYLCASGSCGLVRSGIGGEVCENPLRGKEPNAAMRALLFFVLGCVGELSAPVVDGVNVANSEQQSHGILADPLA